MLTPSTAGTLTTSWTLSLAMYYLLTTPTILQKLKTELDTAIPDPSNSPPLATVENLPYLQQLSKKQFVWDTAPQVESRTSLQMRR
jgi:cytochrome P450